jgi:hypothetical protein
LTPPSLLSRDTHDVCDVCATKARGTPPDLSSEIVLVCPLPITALGMANSSWGIKSRVGDIASHNLRDVGLIDLE